MVTRRKILALMAAAGTVPALASCGPHAGSSDSKLRVYWWGGDLRAGITQEVLDMYTADHPDQKVAPEYSEWSGYWDKLATQTASGAAPNIIQMDEAILEAGRLADGTLVGAPNGFNLYATGMNPTVLEKAGIHLPDDTTWTWDDFLAPAVAQPNPSGGAPDFQRGKQGAPWRQHRGRYGRWARARSPGHGSQPSTGLIVPRNISSTTKLSA